MGILLRLYQGEEETNRSPTHLRSGETGRQQQKRHSAPRLPVNCSQSCHHRHQYSQWTVYSLVYHRHQYSQWTVHSLVITVHSRWLWRTQDPVHLSSHPHGSLPHCRPVQVFTQSKSVWDSKSLSTLCETVSHCLPPAAHKTLCDEPTPIQLAARTVATFPKVGTRGGGFILNWNEWQEVLSFFRGQIVHGELFYLLSFPPNPTVRPV